MKPWCALLCAIAVCLVTSPVLADARPTKGKWRFDITPELGIALANNTSHKAGAHDIELSQPGSRFFALDVGLSRQLSPWGAIGLKLQSSLLSPDPAPQDPSTSGIGQLTAPLTIFQEPLSQEPRFQKGQYMELGPSIGLINYDRWRVVERDLLISESEFMTLFGFEVSLGYLDEWFKAGVSFSLLANDEILLPMASVFAGAVIQ